MGGPVSPVSAMFGRIAGVYDFLNHFLSLGIDRYWRRELVALAKEGGRGVAADLAAGTLDVALALARARPGLVVPAVDFCEPMLCKGLKKLKKGGEGKRIFPIAGDAKSLPLPDDCADSVTMAFGIRNINPRKEAFKEMLRILAPGGRACVLEFGSGKERVWGGFYNFYLTRVLPRIGALAARGDGAYHYLCQTIVDFPRAEELAEEMREAGFEDAHYRKLSGGIVYLHWGHKPGGQP